MSNYYSKDGEMVDLVRCPACRGAKQVMKLGGMHGNCNTCRGKGEINHADLPKPVVVKPVESVSQLVEQVANSVPATTIEHKADIVTLPKDIDVKIDGKKALYKRKTIGK